MTDSTNLDHQVDCGPGRVAALDQMQRETADLELTSALAAVCDIYEAEFRVYLAVLDHPKAASSGIADVVVRN